MADWIYDRRGRPQIIVDGDRFLDRSGVNTIAWINGTNTFTPTGGHAGWYENGVLWDIKNRCVGFTADSTNEMTHRPDLAEASAMPTISVSSRPPEFAASPDRPDKDGWSNIPLDYNFDDAIPLAPSFYEDIRGV